MKTKNKTNIRNITKIEAEHLTNEVEYFMKIDLTCDAHEKLLELIIKAMEKLYWNAYTRGVREATAP